LIEISLGSKNYYLQCWGDEDEYEEGEPVEDHDLMDPDGEVKLVALPFDLEKIKNDVEIRLITQQEWESIGS